MAGLGLVCCAIAVRAQIGHIEMNGANSRGMAQASTTKGMAEGDAEDPGAFRPVSLGQRTEAAPAMPRTCGVVMQGCVPVPAHDRFEPPLPSGHESQALEM